MPRKDKDDIAFLRDMLSAAREVVEFSAGRTWADYQSDKALRRCVERSIELVGEAARHISDECQAAHPEIPWNKIIPQRHRLAHDYDTIDDSIIWSVAVKYIPPLIVQLEATLPPDPPGIDAEWE
jgi:uncharacterized protein with HEPN domain